MPGPNPNPGQQPPRCIYCGASDVLPFLRAAVRSMGAREIDRGPLLQSFYCLACRERLFAGRALPDPRGPQL